MQERRFGRNSNEGTAGGNRSPLADPVLRSYCKAGSAGTVRLSALESFGLRRVNRGRFATGVSAVDGVHSWQSCCFSQSFQISSFFQKYILEHSNAIISILGCAEFGS